MRLKLCFKLVAKIFVVFLWTVLDCREWQEVKRDCDCLVFLDRAMQRESRREYIRERKLDTDRLV